MEHCETKAKGEAPGGKHREQQPKDPTKEGTYRTLRKPEEETREHTILHPSEDRWGTRHNPAPLAGLGGGGSFAEPSPLTQKSKKHGQVTHTSHWGGGETKEAPYTPMLKQTRAMEPQIRHGAESGRNRKKKGRQRNTNNTDQWETPQRMRGKYRHIKRTRQTRAKTSN